MPEARNIFTKLLHQDSEKTFQPEGTYYSLKNCRVIQRNDGSFSIQTDNGTQYMASLPNAGWKIIGFVTDGDKRIYTWSTATEDTTGGPGEIGYFELSISTAGLFSMTYEPIYFHNDLLFSTKYPISKHAVEYVEESPSNKKLKWSDRFNYPRLLNVASPRLDLVSGSNIDDGVYYQVVEGTATYNGTTYGPFQGAGNVFLGVTGITSVTAGGGHIVKHIDVEDLRWTPAKDTGEIYCSGYGTGALLCGSYVATYALRNSEGYQSGFTYHTQPIHIGEGDLSTTDTKGYHDYQGGNAETASNKSIKLTINNIDQDFREIVIVLIRFTEEGLNEVPQIYNVSNITGTSMTIEITTLDVYGQLTVEELKEVLTVFQKVGTFAINKNRLFAADVELTDGLEDWDVGQVGHSWFAYETPSDTIGHDNIDGVVTEGWSGHLAAKSSVLTGELQISSWYQVSSVGGSGFITYNAGSALTYGPGGANGNYFQCVEHSSTGYIVDSFTTSGDAVVQAVIRIANFNGDYRYYPVVNDFYDCKGVVGSSIFKSFRRGGEKYRIGIMPISLEGMPMFVHWLKDVVTPEQNTFPITGRYNKASGSNQQAWTLKHMGIRIGTTSQPLDLTEIQPYCSAVCVVVGVRQPKAIAQGLVGLAFNKGGTTDKIVAEADVRYSKDKNWVNGATESDSCTMFFSPEYLFDDSSVDGKTSNLRGKVVAWVDDFERQGITANPQFFTGASIVANRGQYFKYHDSVATPNSYYYPTTTFDIERLTQADGSEFDLDVGHPTRNWEFRTYHNDDAGAENGFCGKSSILYTPNHNLLCTPGNSLLSARAIVDIIDKSQEGQDFGDPSNTQYILAGHILPLNSTTYANNGNSWKFDGIEVFGGDVYVNFFNFQKTYSYADSITAYHGKNITASIPVESKINVAMRRGRHGFKDASYHSTYAPEGMSYNNREEFTADNAVDAYLNRHVDGLVFPNVPKDFIANNIRRNHLYFTEAKIVGELQDSFRRFPAANERIMEIANGYVTALARDSGKLFCFQEDGVLHLPVTEASTISSDIGTQVLIGVSGVVDRYDEQTDYYGLQDRFHLIQTDYGFMWVDIKRGKIMSMSTRGVMKYSSIKGLGNYIENFLRNSDLLSNPTGLNPLEGVGISSGYDERYSEAYFTFFTATTSKESFTVGVNALHNAFTGFYDFKPTMYLELNGMIFGTPNYNLAEYTSPGIGSGGITLPVGTKFVFTHSSGRKTLYRVNTAYLTTGSETNPDTETKISRLCEVGDLWLFDSPFATDICRYFNEPATELIHLIVNENPNTYKRFKAIAVAGNAAEASISGLITANKHDNVQYITEEHSATGTTTTWRFRRGAWRGALLRDENYALVSSATNIYKRRMRGRYLEIILTHDHNAGKGTSTSSSSAYADLSDQEVIKVVSVNTTYNENDKIAE